MKKLSEIQMDEYIFVGGSKDVLMTKNDYLQSHYSLDKEYQEIYETSKVIAYTCWKDVIRQLEEEQHEDWAENVLEEINCNPILIEAIKTLNKIFENNPTYYAEGIIDNDMLKEDIESDSEE